MTSDRTEERFTEEQLAVDSKTSTQECLELYERTGALILKNAFAKDDIARIARRAMQRFASIEAYTEREESYPAPPELQYRPTTNAMCVSAVYSDALLKKPQPAPDITDLFRASWALEIVRGVLGGEAWFWKTTSSVRKVYTRSFDEKRLLGVPLHCDGNSFASNKIGDTFLTCVVPLQAMTANSPGIEIFYPSTKELFKPDQSIEGVPAEDRVLYQGMEISVERLKEAIPDTYSLVPNIDVGDILMFDQYLLHRSHVTKTMTHERISFDYRVQATGMRNELKHEAIKL